MSTSNVDAPLAFNSNANSQNASAYSDRPKMVLPLVSSHSIRVLGISEPIARKSDALYDMSFRSHCVSSAYRSLPTFRRNLLPPLSILEMEAADSSETLVKSSVRELFRKASCFRLPCAKNSYSVTKTKES
jgi:hypothetical protein